jgi:hypothetical protein
MYMPAESQAPGYPTSVMAFTSPLRPRVSSGCRVKVVRWVVAWESLGRMSGYYSIVLGDLSISLKTHIAEALDRVSVKI